MRVLVVSKALVVGAYQRKLEELAHFPDMELIAAVPPSWRDPSYETRLERLHTHGYELVVTPIAINGSYHLFFFPQLGRLLDEHRPDLVHIDEEPYNLATFIAIAQCRRRGLPSLFFAWQNLVRRYPPPFRWMEQYAYRSVAWAIAGTQSAAAVLRRKGFRGRLSVIPQFGVDPELFRSARPSALGAQSARRPFTVGFAGRVVREKGLPLLVEACARLPQTVELLIFGSGPALSEVQAAAEARGMTERVRFAGIVASGEMPRRLQELDVVVLPSISRFNWTEQFGRILVEAMACGIPVIGSTCGDIPTVIGDAGLIFPEGDVDALATALDRLASDVALRAELARRGRTRVLEHFTYEQIATATVDVYREALRPA
ncbi:MAG: glycosyltransferase [Chloroflexi bacterium]|nr:glycosyltransferase [Chloroflexota bacterium]